MGVCRRATEQDIEHLEACRRDAISRCAGYDAAQLQIWLAAQPNWQQLIDDVLLVEVEGQVVGFCAYTTTELKYLYVHSGRRGGNWAVSGRASGATGYALRLQSAFRPRIGKRAGSQSVPIGKSATAWFLKTFGTNCPRLRQRRVEFLQSIKQPFNIAVFRQRVLKCAPQPRFVI